MKQVIINVPEEHKDNAWSHANGQLLWVDDDIRPTMYSVATHPDNLRTMDYLLERYRWGDMLKHYEKKRLGIKKEFTIPAGSIINKNMLHLLKD